MRARRGCGLAGLVMVAVMGSGAVCGGQDTPAQRVGGGSTFDTSLSTSGSERTTARRPLPGLSSVPEDFFVLKLGPGFLLRMEVYDTPEMSTDLRVDGKGDVTVPTIGVVHVAGKTITEAQTEIADRLRSGEILKNPQVSLDVVQYAGQSVSVIGEVHTPGRVELLSPHSLPDVLAMVGGETQYAGSTIELRRRVDGADKQIQVHYEQSKKSSTVDEVQVLPGDVVTVRRAGIVYVLGAVNRPGGYVMQEDGSLSISQAIALAAGTTINASIGSVRVIRKEPDGTLATLPVAYSKVTAGKTDAMTLRAEDVVYVPVSKMRTVVTSTVTAGVAGAAIYALH